MITLNSLRVLSADLISMAQQYEGEPNWLSKEAI